MKGMHVMWLLSLGVPNQAGGVPSYNAWKPQKDKQKLGVSWLYGLFGCDVGWSKVLVLLWIHFYTFLQHVIVTVIMTLLAIAVTVRKTMPTRGALTVNDTLLDIISVCDKL